MVVGKLAAILTTTVAAISIATAVGCTAIEEATSQKGCYLEDVKIDRLTDANGQEWKVSPKFTMQIIGREFTYCGTSLDAGLIYSGPNIYLRHEELGNLYAHESWYGPWIIVQGVLWVNKPRRPSQERGTAIGIQASAPTQLPTEPVWSTTPESFVVMSSEWQVSESTQDGKRYCNLQYQFGPEYWPEITDLKGKTWAIERVFGNLVRGATRGEEIEYEILIKSAEGIDPPDFNGYYMTISREDEAPTARATIGRETARQGQSTGWPDGIYETISIEENHGYQLIDFGECGKTTTFTFERPQG